MKRMLTLSLFLVGCTTRGSIGVPATLTQTDAPLTFSGGKVDLLFMIDNSPSMEAMQAELRRHFGDLVARVSGIGSDASIDLHVAVVTSDYGAGPISGGGCQASPGGQLGHLQALGADADPGCQPPTGAPFIRYVVDKNGTVTSNLPAGQDFVQTFTCMASVGSRGCGFEHQLESVYAALQGDAVSTGFLRDDAPLTIVFLTNEDDGSAPPTAEIYSPAADEATFGAYDTYRQTRFGVACGSPPSLSPYGPTLGPLAGCDAAPAIKPDDIGKEYDVSRYIQRFTLPRGLGGIKGNPMDVALIGIEPPSSPFEVILAQNGTGLGLPANPSYVPCGPIADASCRVRLQHACQNKAVPAFFGDPPVRLESVIRAAAVHELVSICGVDENMTPDFTGVMQGVGTVMLSQLAGGCFYLPPVLADGEPSCTVTVGDGAAAQQVLSCASGASRCWKLVSDGRCPGLRDPISGAGEQLRLALQGVDVTQNVRGTCRVYPSR
jgi:hypothetical protein